MFCRFLTLICQKITFLQKFNTTKTFINYIYMSLRRYKKYKKDQPDITFIITNSQTIKKNHHYFFLGHLFATIQFNFTVLFFFLFLCVLLSVFIYFIADIGPIQKNRIFCNRFGISTYVFDDIIRITLTYWISLHKIKGKSYQDNNEDSNEEKKNEWMDRLFNRKMYIYKQRVQMEVSIVNIPKEINEINKKVYVRMWNWYLSKPKGKNLCHWFFQHHNIIINVIK